MEQPSAGGQSKKQINRPSSLSFYSECDDTDYPVILKLMNYLNGNLAIMLQTKGEEGPESFAVITVNFPTELLPPNQAYLDTNNVPGIEQFVKENGLGKPMYQHHVSGFCTYPLYEFDLFRCLEHGELANSK